MFKVKNIFLACAIISVTLSCRKDFERPNWDVDLLAPLVKTSLTLNDLLPDSILETNPDTSLKLVYKTNIFDIDVDSLFKIPDTTLTDIYTIPFNSTADPGSAFYSSSEEASLSIDNGVEINYAIIKSGFIELEVFSQIKEKIVVTYTIPTAIKNGDTLEVTGIMEAATSTKDGHLKTVIDISGYELDFTGISKSKFNTIVTRAVGVVDTNALSPVSIQAGDKITYSNTLRDVVPYFVRGYFGNQQVHLGPEVSNFTAFNQIVSGSIDLEQVNVDLEFRNGFGIDVQLILNQFSSVNTNVSSNSFLTHSSIGVPLNLNRGQLTFAMPEVNYSSYKIDMSTTNSNIDQLIEILPNQVMYDMNLNVNPLGNISGGNDFVYKDHPMEINLNVEFPLSMVANKLTLQDTVDFSLDSEAETGSIVDGTLFLYASNGYPFDANLQLGLYDENMNFLQNLEINNQIRSGIIDATLKVSNKTESVISIPLDQVDISNLYLTKHIILNIGFTTAVQPQFVKIYQDYEIDIKLVSDFSYNINLK